MKLLSLKVQNFLSYQDQEIDLADQGVVLISGANGTGKSALFVDAIPWVLYGQTVREKVFGSTNREWSKQDVINRKEGKECRVELSFEVGGKPYEMFRCRGSKLYGNHVELKQVTKHGNSTLTGDTIKDTEARLADLLDLNYSSFCNSLIFASTSTKRFTESTDLERRKILDDFLDLEIYTKAQQLVAADLVEARKDVTKTEQEIYGAQQLAQRAKEEHELAVAKLRDYTSQSESTIELLKTAVVENKTKQTVLAKQQGMIEINLEKAKNAAVKVLKKLLVPAEEGDLDHFYLDLQEREHKYQLRCKDSQFKVENLERDLNKFSPGDQCITCKQKLDEENIEDYKLLIETGLEIERNNLKDFESSLKVIRKQLKSVQKKRSENNAWKSQHLDLKSVEGDLHKGFHKIQTELSNAKYSLLEAESRLSKMDVERKGLEDRQNDTKKDLKGSLEKLQKATKQATEVRENEKKLKFWADGFGHHGVKDLCFDRSLGYLNSQLTEYSRWLTDGQIKIQLERDVDTGKRIEVRVDVPKAADKYILSSQGQSRRIDLCIALAFQSLVAVQHQETNISVFDEAFDGLDPEGIEKFVRFIHQEGSRKGSVFIISHNPEVTQYFEKVWTVEYENGVSSLDTN